MTLPRKTLRALVIEDLPAVRKDLVQMLGVYPEIEVTGEAADVDFARELLARDNYDLVFLDVHLIGGSGFDLVPHVRGEARVIFVTAHDDFALRAFEVNALDYLLKPVKPERLVEALRRAAAPDPRSAPDARPAPEAEEEPVATGWRMDDIVHLNSGKTARFVPLADVTAVEAQENYSLVRLSDGTRLLVRRSLKAWAGRLPAGGFMRVHRTTLVNLTAITGYRREGPKTILLLVRGMEEPVPVGREAWAELKARLPRAFLDE